MQFKTKLSIWNVISSKTSSSPSWQSSSVADCLSRGAGQNEGGYRWHLKSSRAPWPVWPCHAPSFQHEAFQTQLDNNKCRPASEPIRNRTSHRGTATWSDPNEIQQHPSYWPVWGGHRGQGQRPRWPLISRHVWTRLHTMRGLKLVIRICGDKGGREGSKLLQAELFASVCMLLAWWPGQWTSDHRTFAETPSLPPPDVQLLSRVSLLQGQEGGITPGMIPYYWACLPFRLGLVLLAGFGLILLVVLPPVSWSLWCPHTLTTRLQQFPVYPCTNLPGLCVRDAQHRMKLNHYFVHEVKLWLLLQYNYTQHMLTGSNSSVIKNIWSEIVFIGLLFKLQSIL